MNRDDLFDIEVRNKIRKEVNTVPDNINNIFDNTINNLQIKQKRNYKIIASIILIVILGVSTLGITIAPYADEIPILRSLFKDLKLNGKEQEVGIDLKNIQKNFNVNNFTVTPTNYILEASNEYYGNTLLRFNAFDENGNYIPYEGQEFIRFEKEYDKPEEYLAYKFKKQNENVKAITFIPYICIFQGNPARFGPNYDYTEPEGGGSREVQLNLEGSTKLTTKYGEDYGEITKVEILEDMTKLYYKPTRGNYTIFEQIYDSQKTYDTSYPIDKYYRNDMPTTKYIKETGEFVISFTKPLEDKKYTLVYYDNSKSEVHYFDKAFTVDVTK